MEHYSNFGTFEIDSFPNVPGHSLGKYGMLLKLLVANIEHRHHFNIISISGFGLFYLLFVQYPSEL